MVLIAVQTDVAEQVLQLLDAHHARAAEGVERIVSEFALAYIGAQLSGVVAGGNAAEAHGAGFDASHAGAERIRFAYGTGNDLLEVHAHVREEMLGKVAAMEADGLIGIVAVVVIPIEEGTGRAGGKLQRIHAYHAADVHFA